MSKKQAQKYGKMKTKSELNSYKTNINNLRDDPLHTKVIQNENLIGTDDAFVDMDPISNVVFDPKREQFHILAMKLFKKHVSAVIVSLLAMIIFASLGDVKNTYRNIAVIDNNLNRAIEDLSNIKEIIQTLRSDLNDIPCDVASREILLYEISLLESEINHGIERINDRINFIQHQIDDLKLNSQHSATP